MQTGDGQIISQCLNGNPAIFGVLVDKYKEGIYAFVYSKLGNFHDAQDITQETFSKAYQKLYLFYRVILTHFVLFFKNQIAMPSLLFVADQINTVSSIKLILTWHINCCMIFLLILFP